MIFNWQSSAWAALSTRRAQLPQALLLVGRQGLGKSHLARVFAQSLLCERPGKDSLPCGNCQACGWFNMGNHPDYRLVQPESLMPDAEDVPAGKKEKKKSDQIRIEQIRDLEGFLAVGTHRGGMRVILIDPAEAMNFPAQNSLLKNLEEPPPSTLFLLVASQPQRLLPTVRSRCQILPVPLPAADLALEWLKEQGVDQPEAALSAAAGAPLAAVASAGFQAAQREFFSTLKDRGFDPVQLAQTCDAMEPPLVVGWLQRWVQDILQVRAIGTARYYPAFSGSLEALSKGANAAGLTRLLRRLSQARALAQHPLNSKLFYEDIFLEYRKALKLS